jgi:hypothetical protein
MIIIDYSQVSLSNILSFKKELSGSQDEIRNLIRHVTLNTIKSYKKQYGKQYGDIVIACDGRKYWRRDFFEFYKASRKKAREESDLDWHLIFDILGEIREDIKKYFPYKVIHLEKCEADDIVATLVKYTQENELVSEGIVQEPQPVLIVSSDKDFKQLHRFNNVRQWSPIQKKYVKINQSELREFVIEHVVKGDSGDGIPNILSKDDIFLSGERQKPVSAKRLEEFYEKGFDACKNDEERRNWHRNSTLVDFAYIPEDVSNNITNEYLNSKPNNDKMVIMKYLMDNRCRLLLDELEDF